MYSFAALFRLLRYSLPACRITFGLGQGVHRVAQLRLKMGDQRRGKGHDKPFDVLKNEPCTDSGGRTGLPVRSIAYVCLRFQALPDLNTKSTGTNRRAWGLISIVFAAAFEMVTVQQVWVANPASPRAGSLESKVGQLVHHFNQAWGWRAIIALIGRMYRYRLSFPLQLTDLREKCKHSIHKIIQALVA